jgi:hypothetical protein
MSTTTKLRDAELRMHQLLEEAGLPLPDEVEYREDDEELALFWNEQKLAIIIECADVAA